MLPMIFRAPDAEAGSGDGAADQAFIVAEGDALQLPEGFDPAGASYARAGPDLMLTGADGSEVIVADFFMIETPPALLGGNGSKISGDLAVRLAGPQNPGEVAGEAAPMEAIGRVTSVTGEVTVIHSDGTRVTLHTGDSMFMGDILETGADSGIGVLLADGTSLAMADDGRMVLDEMVYDPGTQEGSVALSVLRGVFTIVSGEVSKTNPDAMQVSTPMATIGIRGTQIGIDLTGEHGLTVVMMEESDGFIGEITVTNDGGVMTLNQAYYALTVDSFSAAPAPAQMFAHDMLLNTFGVTFAFLPVSGTTANDYGLQASLAEGLSDFDTLAGEDAAAFETAAGGEQAADEADANVVAGDVTEDVAPEELVTDAGAIIAPDSVAFGEEIAPMPVMEDIVAAALGEIEVTAPPPPPPPTQTEVPPAPVIDPAPAPEPVTPEAVLPVLAVASAAGSEDVGVALAIAATMPAGTSETISIITIAGVPDGAWLSAGTDNGDGTWGLTPDDLSGLIMTPPIDFSGTFELSVTAVSSDGGLATQNIDATVAAVSDAPTLTVSDVVVEIPTVPGEEIEGGKGDDVLVGGAGDDTIDGGQGDDVIFGDQADTDVSGDDGDDDDHGEGDGKGHDEHGEGLGLGHEHDGDAATDGGGGVIPTTEVPLDVNAALTDVDGSEALSIEISGVPADAVLNVGTDSGDGTWTLTGEDLSNLGNLTMTLAEGSDADNFALSVTATSTEASTGEFSTANGVIDVTFEGGGGGGADVLSGGQGDDTIYAGGGADVVDGGEGDDALYGGAGDDQIDGGQGDDLIVGGAGDDVLVGGQGEDAFVFRAGDGDDIVLDFGQQDELRFEGPEFSAEDFSLQTNGDESATITFGADAGVSVTLNDFDFDAAGGGEGYTVTQDGDAVVVSFQSDDSGGS